MVAGYILFETRTGDEKDDNDSLQRFGVLHLLQRKIMEGSVADFSHFTEVSYGSFHYFSL